MRFLFKRALFFRFVRLLNIFVYVLILTCYNEVTLWIERKISMLLDLLIIGAGPTGIFASFYAGMKGLKAVLIESQNYVGGQMTALYKDKPVYDIPGKKGVIAQQFIDDLMKQYEVYHEEVPLITKCEANAIKKTDFGYIVSTNLQDFETKSVLICSGSGSFEPKLLDVPGSEHPKVIYHVEDVKLMKDKDVLILGGGDSALDFGMLLEKYGAHTKILHRREHFRAHETSIQTYEKLGHILKPYQVLSILEEQKKLNVHIEHAETKETSVIVTDYVLVNYGFSLKSSFYQAWGLDMKGKELVVSSTMETSEKGIYAVGNAVTYKGKTKNILSGLGEVSTAISEISKMIYPHKIPVYSSMMGEKENKENKL